MRLTLRPIRPGTPALDLGPRPGPTPAAQAAAEQRAAEADQWHADAKAAAEEMAVQMDAAHARADQAEAARAAAETDRDAAIEQARAEASRPGSARRDRYGPALNRAGTRFAGRGPP